jgi:predicted GNAT family acetyltransferase
VNLLAGVWQNASTPRTHSKFVQLRIHANPASFLRAAAAFLRVTEAENSVMVTAVTRMIAAPDPDDTDTYFACAMVRGAVAAAALHVPDGALLVTGGPARAIESIAADLAARKRFPKRLVGPLSSCDAFAQVWRERTGVEHSLRFRLRHFALTDMPAAPSTAGTMRRAEPAEYDLIARWQAAFMLEAGLPREEAERARARLARRLEKGFVRVWDDRRVVSFAGFSETQRDDGSSSARVAPVYTPPQERGRGYASALVAALSRELLRGGSQPLYLTTDLANPTSNSIYRKIGYRPVADHFHFDLQSAATGGGA